MEIKLDFVDDKAIIAVEGVITTDNAYLFQEKLDRVLESSVKRLELDFSACRLLCSMGIGKLMLFYKAFSAIGGVIEVTKCSPNVYELLHTIKLNMIIKISL